MAAGDFKWFSQGIHDLGNKIHDLDGDDWRLGIVTSATAPTVNTAGPHWGGTGTTNFATTQVGTGGGYTGPVALSTEAWTKTATGGTMDFDDVTIPQNASGFTNGAYGIIYNNTDANKRAIGYVEISSGGTASITGGSLTLQINASGAFSISQA